MTTDAPEPEYAVHVWPIRVYYEDTDAAGIVYYANYLKFAERGRTEMLRAAGYDHASLLAELGVAVVIRSCAIDYFAPARLDDPLEVRSRLASMSGASLVLRQEVFRSATEQTGAVLLAAADVRLVCVGADMRAARLPDALRHALAWLKRPSAQAI